MEEYYKSGHEKLKELVSLHHEAIIHLIRLVKEKEEKEAQFWNSLREELKGVK